MVNRTIQQKILKMKRRNRHAVLSGGQTRLHTKQGPIPFTEDVHGNTKTGKAVRILVGPVSLSKQVVNTGRGPDKERMQEYYQRVHSYDEALPKTLGFTGFDCTRGNSALLKYQELLRDVSKAHCINYVNDTEARLDLFFSLNQWFWVEANWVEKFWRRSQIYPNKKRAELALAGNIVWVEVKR